MQRLLNVYLAAIFVLSGVLAFVSHEREPFFIVLCLGTMIAPNIMWYHHFVFFLLSMFVWIAWSRFHPAVVLWCFIGLTLVQVDRFYLAHGLLPHIIAHLSILGIVIWQSVRWLKAKGVMNVAQVSQ